MESVIARPASREPLLDWIGDFVERVGHLWYENPLSLGRFLLRLLAAWRCVLFDLSPGQLGGTVWRVVRQTFRTFLRGVFVVLTLGIAIGFGVGAIARAAGTVLQPTFATVIVPALLRDAGPLVLTLFVAGRMGGSIAARLGSASLIPDRALPLSDRDISWLVLPYLMAAVISSAVFYSFGAWLAVKGYLSLGQPARFFESDPGWYLSLSSIRSALTVGLVKSLGFGALVAFIASAYGIAARERDHQGTAGVDDVQDAVWETNVTSVLLATIISVVLWLAVEEPLR